MNTPQTTPLESAALSLVAKLENRRISRLPAIAERLTKYVIRRLENPKYGDPPAPFSATDKADALAAGIAACASAGFFESGEVSHELFRKIRNAIAGRDCLRMRCKSEVTSEDFQEIASQCTALAFASDATASDSLNDVRRLVSKEQTLKGREVMRCLRAAKANDKSRKREASFKSNRDFFLLTLANMTGKGKAREIGAGAFDTRKSRFLDYLASGSAAIRAKREIPLKLGAEIMQALASRFL